MKKFKRFPVFLILYAAGILICSCKEKDEKTIESRLIPIRAVKGYIVPQDSIAPPVSIEIDERKLKKVTVTNPRRVSANSNSIPAILTKSLPLDTLKICISGQESIVLPTKQALSVTPVPAPVPEVVIAKDMQVKDNNPYSFGIFRRLQGLKHPHVLNMMEDHQGNIWFCTAGAFTKYDGKYFSHFILSKDLDDWTCFIHEDSSGVIWFGTSDKLIRYDGTTFAQITESDGIFPLNATCVEKSGTIWRAVKSGGVNRISFSSATRDGTMHYIVEHFGEKEGLTDQVIEKIFQDQSGHVWFIFKSGLGLVQLDMHLHGPHPDYTFFHFKSPEAPYDIGTPDIVQDKDGRLWFSGTGGVIQYDGVFLTMYSDPAFAGDQMFPRVVDRNGTIWGSIYKKGLFEFKPSVDHDSGTFTHLTMEDGLSSNSVESFLQDKSGNIWIATLDGVNLFNGKILTHLTKNEGLMYPEAMSIKGDPTGNIWISSTGFGVTRYDARLNDSVGQGNSFIHYTMADGLSDSYIWSIENDRKGNVWFGTLHSGVSRFTPSGIHGEGTFTNFTKADGLDAQISVIYEDHVGNVWIGESSVNARLCMYSPPEGNSSGLLKRYALAQGLSDTSIMSIVEDNDFNMWFGMRRGGLTRYIPPTTDHPAVFTHFTKKEGLSNNEVRSIVKDYKGHLWFGTYGDGLMFFDGTHFVDITEKEGLSNNYVVSSMSDHAGNLWFGTRSGLNKLSKNVLDTIAEKVLTGTLRESDVSFRTYMYEDGFLGGACYMSSICERNDGTIWVGTNDRVTVYHPEGDTPDTIAPNIQLTGIELFNESMDWSHLQQHPDSSIALSNGANIHHLKFDGLSSWYGVPNKLSLAHDNNNVTFHFIGITMDHPGKVKYQYRLDGLDDNWSPPTSNNYANYGNLLPGRYTFSVMAMNSEKFWSHELTYLFTIRLPWWHRWWAYSFYSLLILATIYAIYDVFRKRLLLRHQIELEHREALRLKELDIFKSQLFTNLTHEFRTPLTVIIGMTKQLATGHWKSVLGQDVNDKVSLGLKLIENNGKNLLHLINQLLDLSKLENNSFRLHAIQSDIVPYLRYVTESFQSYAEDHELTLRFISYAESLVMDFDPEQMKQILTNLISNALKFTPAGGEITVELMTSSDKLDIVVTDTGIGISEKDLPHVLERFYQADSSNTRTAQGTGIGLAHTQELLKVMGGNISIESEPGKGTRVMVQLPVRHIEKMIAKDEMTLTAIPHMSIIGLNKRSTEDLQDDIIRERSGQESKPQLLLIEDSSDVVLYLRSSLEHAYEIDVAFNGKDGIDKAVETIPDLIISDVMMPLKDGFQVCDALKNDERTSHVPIILLTAKADAASRLTGLRRGADGYLAKPFDLEELLICINALLENRKRMAAHFSRIIQKGASLLTGDIEAHEDIQIENVFLQKVNAIIELHYTDENYALPQLCLDLGMSRSQLFRKLKAVANIAPSDLIRTYRLQKAKAILEKGDLTVAEVTYQVGFRDPSYFSKIFQEEFGVLPSAISILPPAP